MKKAIILFLTIISFSLLFTVAIFAKETTVEADELSDIHNAISEAEESDSVVINLAKDIAIPNTSNAIRVEKAITVTINFNGYTIYAEAGSASAGTVYGMRINSNDAKLILNGTTNVDPVNYVAPGDQKISISNGEVNDPNEALGIKSPDYASNGPAIYLSKGTLELNNMYINEYHTGEWAIFIYDTTSEHRQDIKITNSIVRVPNSNSLLAVGRRDGGTQASSLTQIEGSVIYGFGGGKETISFGEGSYMRNSRVAQHVAKFDSYMLSSAYPKAPIEIQNVIFEKNIYYWTGRFHLNFIDCTFPKDYTIEVKGDREGSAKLIMTETATCDKAGKQAYIIVANNTTKNIKAFSDLDTTVDEYAQSNPALGHKITIETATGVTWDNYFENGMYCGYCSVCNQDTHEVKGSASPLFVNKGLSFAEYEDSTCQVSQGFKVNKEMTKFLDEGFDYGVIATINKGGEEIAPELNGQKVVSASFANVDFEMFYIKLTSIPAAEKDTAIVFCAYLVNGEDKYYLNEGKTSKTVVGLSYNYVSTK